MLSKVLRGDTGNHAQLLVLHDTRAGAETAREERASPGNAPKQHPDAELMATIAGLTAQLNAARETSSQAERTAFAKGEQKGRSEAQAELEPILARLKAAIVDTVGLRTELRHAAEKDLVHLALAIAKRVLHRELQVDESALNALARFAFDRLARAESYRVTTHPRFATAIQSSLPLQRAGQIELDADPSCAPGTLVIHTENGRVDASVDVQLEEITKGLTDRIA